MRRTSQLVAVPVVLVGLCLAAAEPPKLQEVCSTSEGIITCHCSSQHPEIDVVSIDTGYLSGAQEITIGNCSVVKMAPHALEETAGLKKLSVLNVSYLELKSPLPSSLRVLVLSNIDKLASISVAIFQEVHTMESLIIRYVGFDKLESHFLHGIELKFTEITRCSFPNLGSKSINVKSQRAELIGNKFGNLSAYALTVTSENAIVSDNSFGGLDNDCIQWKRWPSGEMSRLTFERNIIESVQGGALAGLRSGDASFISDNVLLCNAGDYKHCKGSLAEAGGLRVCDAEDVCPYRKRTALTEALAAEKRCGEESPLSAEVCSVIAVVHERSGAAVAVKTMGNTPSRAAVMRLPSSMTAAVAVLAVICFAT